MVALAWDSAASFSAALLRSATWFGALAFLGCLALMVLGLVVYVNGTVIPGWTSLFLAVLLLSGVRLLCLGLLGEYVGRVYAALQDRPAFHVGFDSGEQTYPLTRRRGGRPPDAVTSPSNRPPSAVELERPAPAGRRAAPAPLDRQ